MKVTFFGTIFLLSSFIVHIVVAEESRFNRTRLYSRRKNRLSTTESPAEDATTTEAYKLSPSASVEKVLADVRAEHVRKLDELVSPKSKCGLLKVNNTIPWIVVIEHTDPTGKDRRKSVSKGVLIDDRHVLTTVSSIHNARPFWVVTSIRLGDVVTWITETSQRNDSITYSRIEVDQVFQHSSKDIAIIKLSRKVEFTNYIQPACLPIDDNYNFREMYFHLCKRLSDKERKFDVKLLSSMPLTPQDCETMFHRKGAQFEATEFCAWDEFGDSCIGDVGGPLMANFNGRYLVIGLNSYVFTQEEFEADVYPGVYVKVGAFLKWINSVLDL